MFSFFKRKKTVDDIFDKDDGHIAKLGGWIGNLKLTPEEQLELYRDMGKSCTEHAKATMEENTDRSKTRRNIAIMVIQCEMLFLFLAGILYPFNEKWSDVWFMIATCAVQSMLVCGVAGFFFGSHMMSSHLAKKK